MKLRYSRVDILGGLYDYHRNCSARATLGDNMAKKIRPMLDYVKEGIEKVNLLQVSKINFLRKGPRPPLVQAFGLGIKGHWGTMQPSWGVWCPDYR